MWKISQVQPALQILFLLFGVPLLLGVPIPIPGYNPSTLVPIPILSYNPSTQTHQIFRSPLKIQPHTDDQELTTTASVTGISFHSDAGAKTKEGTGRRGIPTNGQNERGDSATIVDKDLLPCLPLASQNQGRREGREPFRWEKNCVQFTAHSFHVIFFKESPIFQKW